MGGGVLQHHTQFLTAGPPTWMRHDYASGKQWLRTFEDNPSLNPEILIARAAEYCEFCRATKVDELYIKHPQNWLREGGWTIDWSEQMKASEKKYRSKEEEEQYGYDFGDIPIITPRP